MKQLVLFIGLLYLSLGNLFPQQIPLQTFISAGGATGNGTTPSYFASVGQPFVIERTVSLNAGGGVMTANEFMFTQAVATLPTAQPTALVFSNVTSSSFTVSFTAATGSPAGYIVIRKSGAAPSSLPVISTTYNVADTFGDATVVYVGTGTTFNDSGLNSSTMYYYEVFSFNGSGATINYLTANPLSGNQATGAADTTPPNITANTTPSSVDLGTSTTVPVSVTVVDNESTVQNVTISYGPANSSSLIAQDKNMTNSSGNVWTFSVPGSAVTELGLFYQIQAFSAGGNTAYIPYSVSVNYTGSGLKIPYASNGVNVINYRVVSVPLVLPANANTVDKVFDELGPYGDKTKWRMYRYDNEVTTELTGSTTIEPGKGYWLIAKDGTTINSGAGTTVPANSVSPFQINLKADWNEIGNPYNFNLSWDDIQAANPGLPTVFRKFDGNPDYVNASQLNSMEGGFVKVTTAQTIVIPTTKNAAVNGRNSSEAKQNRNSLDSPNWQVGLTLQQGDLANKISGFGMNENASVGFDIYDGFNMPKFFDTYLVLNHTKKDGEDYYSSDVVPTSNNYAWEFFVESTAEGRLISVQWDNSYFGQNAKELYLLDVSLQRSINMRSYNSYQFDKNASRSFKVVYGDQDFVKEKIAVQEMVLHAIWPNPTSGDATISFSLPESASSQSVEFLLTDMLGKNIWSNLNSFSSGYNEVMLKRTNGETAGVYIVRLTSGSTVKQARLVFK